MASLRKRGKYYYVIFWDRGKQHQISTRTSSKKIAEEIKRTIENELARGIFNIEDYSARHQVKLSEFLDEYFEYAKTNKSPSTVQRERRVLRNFFNFFGDVPINSIQIKEIESYKTYLLNEKNFKPSGINIELRHLSAAFSVAVKFDYLKKNPFKNVKKVQVPKKKPKFLTKEQATKLLNEIKGSNYYDYVIIALYTGARAGEVVNLKWKDVDLKNRTIKFFGKGAKERTVPIPEILVNYLKSKSKRDLNDYVCEGTRRVDNLSQNFRKYADRAGLKEFTFHNLRDTYASWLTQKGVSLAVIQKLLGHENIGTTMIYAHIAPDNRFEAVKVIDQVLSNN